MRSIASLFHRKTKSDRPHNGLARDPAFVQFPRSSIALTADPWRVDFWHGHLPICPKLRHMIAVSHLRRSTSSAIPVDRRSPHKDFPEATHQFFLLFVEPPATDRKLVWRAQLDLGHELLQGAIEAHSVAQNRYRALTDSQETESGSRLAAIDRAMREMGKTRATVSAAEQQIDRCARNVCEAIALAMESATLPQLLRADKQSEAHWADVAGFAVQQCEYQKTQNRKKPLADRTVRGVVLD